MGKNLEKIITGMMITTLTACGGGGGGSGSKEISNPPHVQEIVYTNESDINNRFILKEGGHIVTGAGLSVNPNTELERNKRNNEFNVQFNNYFDTLRQMETVTHIYLESGAGNTWNDNYTVGTLRQFETISNTYNRPVEAWISPGIFNGDTHPYILLNPTILRGSGRDKTEVNAFIISLDYLGVKDITSKGQEVTLEGNGEEAGSLLMYAGGEFYDSNVTKIGVVGVAYTEPFLMDNVLFEDLVNPFHETAFYFERPLITDKYSRGVVNSATHITNTTFKKLPIAIYATHGVDVGGAGISTSEGNNSFTDVEIAIYHPEINAGSTFATGNYWSETKRE